MQDSEDSKQATLQNVVLFIKWLIGGIASLVTISMGIGIFVYDNVETTGENAAHISSLEKVVKSEHDKVLVLEQAVKKTEEIANEREKAATARSQAATLDRAEIKSLLYSIVRDRAQ